MKSRTVMLVGIVSACVALAASRPDLAVQAQAPAKAARPQLTVRPVADFEVNGAGDHAAWKGSDWTPLRRRQADGHPYDTRFKSVYSKTGIYFLIDGTDRNLTAMYTPTSTVVPNAVQRATRDARRSTSPSVTATRE